MRIFFWLGLVVGLLLLVQARQSAPPLSPKTSTSCAHAVSHNPGDRGPCTVEKVSRTTDLGAGVFRRRVEFEVYLPVEGAGTEKFPIVLFSPGLRLARSQYVSYLRHLASWGYVALVTERSDFWMRHETMAAHVKAVLDWLIAEAQSPESPLYGRADVSRVGLGGHSIGGKVAFMVAIARLRAGDRRILGVFGIDPVDDGPFGPSSLFPSVTPEQMGSVGVPFVALGETTDSLAPEWSISGCAPAGSNFRAFFHNAVSPAVEIDVLGAGHMSFLDNPDCGSECKACRKGSADAENVKQLARRYITAFFQTVLKGEDSFRTFLCGPAMEQDERDGLVVAAYANGFCAAQQLEQTITPSLERIQQRKQFARPRGNAEGDDLALTFSPGPI